MRSNRETVANVLVVWRELMPGGCCSRSCVFAEGVAAIYCEATCLPYLRLAGAWPWNFLKSRLK
jgi:hypothetical protein